MATIENFEDIEAWRSSREVNKLICAITANEKFSRDFALTNQMRRASISVLSNIAEGFERGGDKEFVQFLSVAKGSCGEARAQLYIALDQHYISAAEFDSISNKLSETGRLISGLMKYFLESDLRGSKFK